MFFVCSKGKKRELYKEQYFPTLYLVGCFSRGDVLCQHSELCCQLCTAQPVPKDSALDPNRFPAEASTQECTEGLPQSTAQNCPPLSYKGRLWSWASSPSTGAGHTSTGEWDVPGNCWKHTPNHALQPGDTCPECSSQRTQCVNM